MKAAEAASSGATDDLSGRPVVVTGASGFVGRRLVARLAGLGVKVVAVVSGKHEVGPFDPGVRVHFWDAFSEPMDGSIFEGPALVCHLAGLIPPSMMSPEAARACLEVNALGTLALLVSASRAGARRFVHLSAGNAYRPGTRPAHEEDPLYPATRAPFYLASKLCGEIYVSHFDEIGAIDACVLRPSAIYGPSMPASGLIPTFARRLREGQPVEVMDGGYYTVDLVHVDDVVGAILAALRCSARGVFNLGSGVLSTPRSVAEVLVSILGADPGLIHAASPSSAAVRGFAPLDATRARRDLGFSPRDLRAGLTDYLASLEG